MTRVFTVLAGFIGLALLAVGVTACSPLALFDAIGPRDDGGRLTVRNASFGPNPRQRLDVFTPVAGTGGAPVLVFFYGGSWKNGTKEDYAFVGQALAAQGFVTVLPDYRLYPEVRFPDFLDDGAAAIAWVRDNIAQYGGDPRRIVLAGHSAGAYNAVMLGLDPRYLRRAGVDPKIVRAVAGLSGPYDFLPLDAGTATEVFGEARDKAATQPVTFAGPHSPPAYLATGDGDTTVRPSNTRNLAARLREARVPVQERVYAGLDHSDTLLALSVTFRSKAPALAEMAAFLRQHAGGERVPSRTVNR
ncbi:alpha/beta hydrolase [Methylobacterium sp. Leaf102]|uniref:alpha/beta hydrolase n=1 Tax=unclassified Methylobacterium TaxID=2615210 RepID=UPI0006F394D5|nr:MULTISPECIES: alpha/beta hydrolase [unclassified Methylobacterium]KQO69787.1 alpha/beta hydrolase [Methylobacterium sp. Leaf87]KQP25209.1 alpha/beta hydrolase [Methylobacterium sp. Leaf102]KQP58995.1 alpha/beta hydrolase [Methylobacterium sp. Leaf112]USU32149.1 alpha/beta hydrolase [Methylobacterium sp. OTU13CASTA1]